MSGNLSLRRFQGKYRLMNYDCNCLCEWWSYSRIADSGLAPSWWKGLYRSTGTEGRARDTVTDCKGGNLKAPNTDEECLLSTNLQGIRLQASVNRYFSVPIWNQIWVHSVFLGEFQKSNVDIVSCKIVITIWRTCFTKHPTVSNPSCFVAILLPSLGFNQTLLRSKGSSLDPIAACFPCITLVGEVSKKSMDTTDATRAWVC